MKALQTVGYKIVKCDNHNRGYYMETHLFEKHELKIIADLVADATFLTVKASTAILQKMVIVFGFHCGATGGRQFHKLDSKAKILRTEELQMQFVEYVRRKYTDYLEQYRL